MSTLVEEATVAEMRDLIALAGRIGRLVDLALTDQPHLNHTNWIILDTLANQPAGGVKMADLAGTLELTPSGLTRAADALEDAGLVKRVSDPDDGRGVLLVLTRAGRGARLAAMPLVVRAVQAATR